MPPPEKARKSTAEMVAYPEERGGAYRPMGAALTIQEVILAYARPGLRSLYGGGIP